MEGKLVIFSAPSGSGKTTLVNYLLSHAELGLAFSISATSREPRPHEVDGRDYYFLDVSDLKNKINNNEFVEWEEVYTNHFYGTLKSEIERIWNAGNHVMFDVDVIGGLNLKNIYGHRALAVFVQPPSIAELKERLEKRGTETPDKLKYRLEKAQEELTYATKFDKIIVNDNLEKAKQEALQTVTDFLLKSA